MTIVITGANRGIGAALNAAYSAQGDTVIGTSRSGTDGLFPLDVTKTESVAALAEHLNGKPVQTLICNAGVYLDKNNDLKDGYPPEMWAQTFAANVTGVFLTVQALMPNLQLAPGAKIAIISSVMASQEKAPGGGYIYRSSKAAVLNLGRNLAVDLESQGISVGIYHPGWVRTEMGGPTASISTEESATGLISRIKALGLETTGCFEGFDGASIPF